MAVLSYFLAVKLRSEAGLKKKAAVILHYLMLYSVFRYSLYHWPWVREEIVGKK